MGWYKHLHTFRGPSAVDRLLGLDCVDEFFGQIIDIQAIALSREDVAQCRAECRGRPDDRDSRKREHRISPSCTHIVINSVAVRKEVSNTPITRRGRVPKTGYESEIWQKSAQYSSAQVITETNNPLMTS